MSIRKSPPTLWHGQLLHLICGILLFVLVELVWGYLGRPHPAIFWVAIAFPIVHQIYVWVTWRLELQSSLVSKTIGFRAYLILFFILFGGRFVSLFALAWVDRGSLKIPVLIQAITTTIFLFISLYAMYSVKRYFGMTRAAGADHFEQRYRSMPAIKEGIFRFTSNGMYIYAFLLFWAIALGFRSTAALAVAVFSHAYIWVHFYATESPDMDFIYGTDSLE